MMYMLNDFQSNQISGGAFSPTCYDAYQKVAMDSKPGFGQGLAILFFNVFGLAGVVGYKMGMRDAVKSICGASFEVTEAEYCLNHPDTCMKPEEKKK